MEPNRPYCICTQSEAEPMGSLNVSCCLVKPLRFNDLSTIIYDHTGVESALEKERRKLRVFFDKGLVIMGVSRTKNATCTAYNLAKVCIGKYRIIQ